ncbi:peptide chain release factor family protein [Stieleria varia]|uniref:Peptide chain release factor 1 n=1 Tax=Stieleria varia TaxID=2528005 RepID=A0A5C6B5G6_9BACT|nr:peptide chain release factor-like protein [Stieleria varia]TWU07535.1 Peptide chain release factor 1 [Stieleria varia]
MVSSPHPAVLDPDVLVQHCQRRTQRRSGPGGQHRNKTDTGVFLTHLPTGIVGEATEKRSQAENHRMALQRLRFRLALDLRTPSSLDAVDGKRPVEQSAIDPPHDPDEAQVRQRHFAARLRMNDTNEAKPGVLALLLNDLHAAGGQPSLVAKRWKISTSGIISFLKSHPAAFEWVNRVRVHHGRPPLK